MVVADPFAFAVEVDRLGPPARVPLFRLRKEVAPGVVDRVYTASEADRDEAVARWGYEPEGVAGAVLDRPGPGTVPLYRLWHGPTRCHAYTVLPEARAAALGTGEWRDEGIAGHVWPDDPAGRRRPLYALAHPDGAHLYTADPAEAEAAGADGYALLGVGCWLAAGSDHG